MLTVLGPQMVSDGCHQDAASGVIISVWPRSDSSEKMGVLRMPSRWVFNALSPNHKYWWITAYVRKGSKWGAVKIANDSTLFSVRQGNIFGLMFSRESHKLGLRDSYARCQPSAQERSIKWNKMWRLWKWSQHSGTACTAHVHSYRMLETTSRLKKKNTYSFVSD